MAMRVQGVHADLQKDDSSCHRQTERQSFLLYTSMPKWAGNDDNKDAMHSTISLDGCSGDGSSPQRTEQLPPQP